MYSLKGSLNLLLLFLFLNGKTQTTGCLSLDLGPDVNLSCSNCTTLTNIIQSGVNTNYTVDSIPYAPAFSFTGGTRISNVDDQWSSAISLPFSFYFYDSAYDVAIIGMNGVVSFDTSLEGSFCAWMFDSLIPVPGPPPGGIYNNSINGAYHDIDPTATAPIPIFPYFTTPANINYFISGNTSNRAFVVNFSTVPQYSCDTLRTTQQIVLYETTNIVEIYIANKPICSSWNDGNAVIGLQNADGTKGITPPGRNTGSWSATNEAWRFTPNGITNLTMTWLDTTANIIGNTADISVCLNETTQYRAELTYTCNGVDVVLNDTVTVNVTGTLSSSFTKTDESCEGMNNGTITLNAAGGTTPYTYTIGTGMSNNTGIFTGLAPNTYNYTIANSNGCEIISSITIQDGYQINSGIIAGADSAEINQTATYSVNAGLNYTWSVNNGVIVSGQGTNSIEVDWNAMGKAPCKLLLPTVAVRKWFQKLLCLLTRQALKVMRCKILSCIRTQQTERLR